MKVSSWCILVLVAFWALVIHAIMIEEQRGPDRRRRSVPVAHERRTQKRRRKALFLSRAAWALHRRWLRKMRGRDAHI
jgi:hypothetical protein